MYSSFIWFVFGFGLGMIFLFAVLFFLAAFACGPLVPWFMMSHSTPDSMVQFKMEHPLAYRWWAFVIWLNS